MHQGAVWQAQAAGPQYFCLGSHMVARIDWKAGPNLLAEAFALHGFWNFEEVSARFFVENA